MNKIRKCTSATFKVADFGEHTVIISNGPTGIITGWNAVWTLERYENNRYVKTLLTYNDGMIKSWPGAITAPGAEILLPIKIKVVRAGVQRSVATRAANVVYWGLIRMDDCMYIIPDRLPYSRYERIKYTAPGGVGTTTWNDVVLPTQYGRFRFSDWMLKGTDAINVENCPTNKILNILSQEEYDKLYKQFISKVKNGK